MKSEYFGKKVREMRRAQNITQAELAAEIGITKRSVINYESGKCMPKQAVVVERIAEYFHVSMEYLLSDGEASVQNAYRRGYHRDPETVDEIVSQIKGLLAGGTLTDRDKDGVMRAILDAYWDTKEQKRVEISQNRKQK